MNPAMAAPNDIAHDSEADAAADAGAHALLSESDHSRVTRIHATSSARSAVCNPARNRSDRRRPIVPDFPLLSGSALRRAIGL